MIRLNEHIHHLHVFVNMMVGHDLVITTYNAVLHQVDCCRHSLFFPDLSCLIAGLRSIAADPDVELVHVKNRLSPAYDGKVTAGYRDVLVNLRLRTKEAQRLNLDNHVWELQLMLISFARIKVICFWCKRGAELIMRLTLVRHSDIEPDFNPVTSQLPTSELWIKLTLRVLVFLKKYLAKPYTRVSTAHIHFVFEF